MNKKHRAFSLIELSIVILIIGIIVTGITQSSRLIGAFKLSTARSLTQSSPVASILNLAFWFEATNERSFKNQINIQDIANNDTIQYWYDSNPISVKGYSASQSTTAYQPTYVTNGINGLPSVRFDATNDNMRLTASIGSPIRTESTVFLVFNWQASNANGNISQLLGVDDTGSAAHSSANSIASNGQFAYFYYDTNSDTELDHLRYYQLVKSKPVIIARTYAPSVNSSKLYANGAQVVTTTAAGTDNNNPATIYIGNHAIAPRTFGGDIGEIIIYERALKIEERQAIEQYLSKKWGIKLT